MKKKLLFVGVAFMALSTMQAQDGVGIGKSIIPDGSAVLDIGATDKGVLFPRVALKGEKDVSVISGGKAANGLLVYNTATVDAVIKPGFYFWNGTEWSALMSKTSTVLSETLTELTIGQDSTTKAVTLVYKAEQGEPKELPISAKLQEDPTFKAYIEKLVTTTTTGVTIVHGTGIHVKEEPNGANGMKYTISTVPSEITLGGNVTGPADATVIADDAVKTKMIADKQVTVAKIASEANNPGGMLLSSKADGSAEWVKQSTIKPDAHALKTDDIITIEGGTDNGTTLAGAVMVETKLSIKDRSIKVGKLAKVEAADANKYLTTNSTGEPEWKTLKSNDIKITTTPVATNEVMDGKRVYTVKFDNAVVEEGQPGLGYNSIIKALPKIDNLEYLLRAEIYDGTNKLVVSSVTDIVNTDGALTFRFGMNKMYSTLPVATNYKVVLKYVSKEVAVTP